MPDKYPGGGGGMRAVGIDGAITDMDIFSYQAQRTHFTFKERGYLQETKGFSKMALMTENSSTFGMD